MTHTPYFSKYTIKTSQETLKELNVTDSGLSQPEVKKRTDSIGKNELVGRQTHWYDILFRQLQSPFLYLLIAAASLSFFLGEKIDGIMILIFVGINSLLGFYQEYRSEKTLQYLKQYVVAKTKVYRDGKEETIRSRELVPGDIIRLQPGDIIPADIRFLTSEVLLVDESLLTGESIAVQKIHEVLSKEATVIYKASNIGFSGTSVVSGKGLGVVIGTGKNTAIGGITSLTVETKHESTFEKGLGRLSNFILKLISITLIFIVLINILLKGPNEQISTLIIFAIALAISVIPEALPVVTTFSFSRGALRLARHKVVVKRLSAIEDLGSIEVLCSDKTGTITENKLTVDSYYPNSTNTALYASLATPLESIDNLTDSFDIALHNALTPEERKLYTTYQKCKEVPFDPKRKRNSVLVTKNNKAELIVRGAFESISLLCKPEISDDMKKWVENEGKQGKRVIAVGKKYLGKITEENLVKEERDLTLVGLISFIDPLKETAKVAIKKAASLNIKIKILTGDSKEVAGAVAAQTGLITTQDAVITGDEFDLFSLPKQHEAVNQYSVFARVSPEQKHRIIQLLQEKYEVGFLGEGINDAPALQAANVAIVVQGASDIARQVADIVLLNRSLLVIIEGIEEGREIFGNTAKYIKATLASNFGNFYTVAIVSLFIPFLPLLPLQILLMNLLTDFPMIAIATDNVDGEELNRPHNYNVKEIAIFATVLGIVSSLDDFLFFILFYKFSPQVLQTNWFIGSVLTELVFIFSVRTRLSIFKATKPSLLLIGLSGLAFITAIMLPFTAFGHNVFSFIPPTFHHLLLILLLTGLYFIITELVKRVYYKFVTVKS